MFCVVFTVSSFVGIPVYDKKWSRKFQSDYKKLLK